MADFEIVPKQITVRLDRTLTVETLEGTAVRLVVPVYMQQRGCLKSPRQIAEGELAEPETEIEGLPHCGIDDAWDGEHCRWCGRPVTSTTGRRKKMYCGGDCRKKW